MNKRGFICGAFDLLHSGHILALKEAKGYCDYLVVGLHIDPSIERKGKTKPIQSILERYIQLKGCKYVDNVIVYETEKDIEIILHNFHIDIRFLGTDYTTEDKEITGGDIVPIHYILRNHPYSSTSLKERARARK